MGDLNANENDRMSKMEHAILMAIGAHKGQQDKAGRPYILHPLRVMFWQDDPEAMITAVLHDAVEDSDVTLYQIAEAGFSKTVIDAIRLLTHDQGTPYMDYIKRVATNTIAQQVKIADLIDNMDMDRIPNPQEKDFLRIEKYKIAYNYLIDGNRDSIKT